MKYRHDVPFCNAHTFYNDMTNTCFSWNLCNDQKFIAFVIYDFCFHDVVYNYKKVTSMMVKINIDILAVICTWMFVKSYIKYNCLALHLGVSMLIDWD